MESLILVAMTATEDIQEPCLTEADEFITEDHWAHWVFRFGTDTEDASSSPKDDQRSNGTLILCNDQANEEEFMTETEDHWIFRFGDVKEPASAPPPVQESESDSFALHAVCASSPVSLETIDAYLETHPEAVLAHNDEGYLPIHLACQTGNASPEVLSRLVQQYPETVFEVTKPVDEEKKGVTAVRLFWDTISQNIVDGSFRDDYSHPDVWPALQTLLEGGARYWIVDSANVDNKDSSKKKKRSKKRRRRKKGDEARHVSVCCLHAAVALHAIDAPIELLHYAIWKYPEQIDLVDGRHRLPLHIAVTSRVKSAAITALLDLNPEAAFSLDPNEQLHQTRPNRMGKRQNSTSSYSSMKSIENYSVRGSRYPLHSALVNGHTWDLGIQELADNCTEAIVSLDSFTSLYPYQMAAIAGAELIADLDTIYGLLRAEPGVLMADDDQETGLGLLVLQSDHERSATSEALLCLTSDDESFEGDYLPSTVRRKSELAAVEEDLSLEHDPLKASIHELSRRSFVSFDDQAQILQQAAAVYQKRKESGFKDLGLMEHIETCKETRANLREVGDPEILRKKKIADFIEEFRRTKPRGKHTHGLSEVEVQERRASLRRVSEADRGAPGKSKGTSPPASPISRMRERLRSANSPRRIRESSENAKVWSPPSAPVAASIASPINFMMYGGKRKSSNRTTLQEPKPSESQQTLAEAEPQSSSSLQFEALEPKNTGNDSQKFGSSAPANLCIGETPELLVKLRSVSPNRSGSFATDTCNEQNKMAPLEMHKVKLRSVKERVPPPSEADAMEKTEDMALSPHKVKLKSVQTKVPKTTAEIAAMQKSQELPLSPHKATLRSVQTKVPKTTAELAAMKKSEGLADKVKLRSVETKVPLSTSELANTEKAEDIDHKANLKSVQTRVPLTTAELAAADSEKTKDLGLQVKLRSVQTKVPKTTAELAAIEKPQELGHKAMLRPLKAGIPVDTCELEDTEKTENPPLSAQIVKLRSVDTRVSKTTAELAAMQRTQEFDHKAKLKPVMKACDTSEADGTEKAGDPPLSPHRVKLKSVQTRVPKTTAELAAMEKPQDLPLSPHKAKLKSVQTRTPLTTAQLAAMEKTQDNVPPTFQEHRKKLRATETKPRSYTPSILLISEEEDCNQDATEQEVALPIMTNIDETCSVENAQCESGLEKYPDSVSKAVEQNHAEIPTEPPDSSEKAPATQNVPVVEPTDTSTGDETPPLKRVAPSRAPSRRISSENVLWKRAEMEIRNQVQRAHTRLERYQGQRIKSRQRQLQARDRMLKRLESVRAELDHAKKANPGIMTPKEEYVTIISEVMEERIPVTKEESECEVDVVMYMHSMIALEKQLELEQIHANAIKTYSLRCQAWLQDYEAIQKHMRDLRVQNMALRTSYKDILAQQEAFFKKCSV